MSRISRVAREHVGESILSLFIKQAWTEAALSWRRHVRFRREKNDADGAPAAVSFRAQSALETFRDARGDPLPGESVDFINSCGSLGGSRW